LRDDYLAVRRARKLGIAAPEPKPEQKKEEEAKKPVRVNCKAVFDRYVEDDYPDQDGEAHVGDHLRAIKDNLEDLRVMFDEVFVDELDQDRLDAYREWRKGNVRLWADHKIKKHMTSHGLRALYVWVRRSQGADDSQIAFEIGHSSPLMIQRVYGSCPPHWRTGKAPNYSCRPTGKLAWSQLDLD
jgi:hypothetical protein